MQCPKAHTARRGSQYGGKGLLVPLKNLYVRTKAVQHIVQHGAVAVQHHPLRRAHKGVNGILRLLPLRRCLAAWFAQNTYVRHAVNAVSETIQLLLAHKLRLTREQCREFCRKINARL